MKVIRTYEELLSVNKDDSEGIINLTNCYVVGVSFECGELYLDNCVFKDCNITIIGPARMMDCYNTVKFINVRVSGDLEISSASNFEDNNEKCSLVLDKCILSDHITIVDGLPILSRGSVIGSILYKDYSLPPDKSQKMFLIDTKITGTLDVSGSRVEGRFFATGSKCYRFSVYRSEIRSQSFINFMSQMLENSNESDLDRVIFLNVRIENIDFKETSFSHCSIDGNSRISNCDFSLCSALGVMIHVHNPIIFDNSNILGHKTFNKVRGTGQYFLSSGNNWQ